jgi:hypothetical protein
MTEEPDLDRKRLAYRQAGYAVARYAQGRKVPDLSMEGSLQSPMAAAQDGDGAGPQWPVDLGSMSRHRVELEILALWAGFLSESRACLGDREPPEGWGPAREPMAALGQRVTRNLDENDAYLEWLRRRALGLIDLPESWAAVETIAAAVLARGAVGSREASAIVSGVNRARRRRSGFANLFRNTR